MKRIQSIIFSVGVLLAPAAFLASCQEDMPEIDYTITMSVVNDFTKVVEAINSGSLKNEAALKALTEAIDKMNVDQATKLQAVIDVLNSVDATLEAKLAAIEAAVKSQTLSLESKLSAIDAAVKSQTISLENKLDLLEKAVKALSESIDKMSADQAAKLQAIIDVLTSVNTMLETKLAALDAAVSAQTISLEGKLDLLKEAIEGLPDYSSRLAAIETAINGLPGYGDKLDAIVGAIEALPDYREKFDAVISALNLLEQNLSGAVSDAEKELAENLAGVSSTIAGLVESVDNGKENAMSALEKIIVKLEELKDEINGYVDLGLSVKWATRNLGATKPSDQGFYYSWGETERMSDMPSWETYKWMTPGQSSLGYITKYTVDDQRPGSIWYDENGKFIGDGKTVLEPEDDAATARLGSSWRTPTIYEFKELFEKCAYEPATRDGVEGMLVVGRNGNSIFLPVTGYFEPDGFYDNNARMGFYWSASLCSDDSGRAYGFYCHGVTGVNYSVSILRFAACPVRPVRP